jgi:hypothetical protein
LKSNGAELAPYPDPATTLSIQLNAVREIPSRAASRRRANPRRKIRKNLPSRGESEAKSSFSETALTEKTSHSSGLDETARARK